MTSYSKDKLWKSVPARKQKGPGSLSNRTRAAYEEVKEVKRKLDYREDEDLRSEFHTKLVALRDLVSQNKTTRPNPHDDRRGVIKSNTEDVICWSPSTKDFDDLRHDDYFTASLDELASRRGVPQKKRVRNYCVVSLSESPTDFCLVRVDDDGVHQREKQIRKYGFTKKEDETYQIDDIEGWLQDDCNSLTVKKSRRNKSNAYVDDDANDERGGEDIMQVLLERLQTRSREKRLKQQVDDIKKTLKDRILDDSSVSAESYSSHVSVDRAVKTLEILSDALKKTESLNSDDGEDFVSAQKNNGGCVEDYRVHGGMVSGRDTGTDYQSNEHTEAFERSHQRRLSRSLVSNSSSSHQVQTNAPLFEEFSDSGSRNTDSDRNSDRSQRVNGSDSRRGSMSRDRCICELNGTRVRDLRNRNLSSCQKECGYGAENRDGCENLHKRPTRYQSAQHLRLDNENNYGDDVSAPGSTKYRKCVCQESRSQGPGSNRRCRSRNQVDGFTDNDFDHVNQPSHWHDEERRTRGVSPESDEGPLTLSELDSSYEEVEHNQKETGSSNGTNRKIRSQNLPSKNKRQPQSHRSEYRRSSVPAQEQVDKSKRLSGDRKKQPRSKSGSRERKFSQSQIPNISKNRQDSRVGDNDVGKATLTLGDVQQLHKEVNVRIQGREADLQGLVLQELKSKKHIMSVAGKRRNDVKTASNTQNNRNRPSTPLKQRGVLIPGRKTEIGSRSVTVDRQESRLSLRGSFAELASETRQETVDSRDKDSIHLSADITIPDLFGMKITKTIQRPDGSGQTGNDFPEKRRLSLSFEESVDGNIENVQCEVKGFDSVNQQNGHVVQSSPRTCDTNENNHQQKIYNENQRNKMVGQLNEANLKYFDEVHGSSHIDERMEYLNNNSLRTKFLSSCVEKLHNGVGRIEDYGDRNGHCLASVFEPPERDISPPLKKHEPFNGNPLISGNLSTRHNGTVGSAADTIMAQLHNPNTLRLLKNLYQADDSRRHYLIVLTQYFKRWQTNASQQKQHRETHDIFMRRAREFQTSHLRTRYFYTWYELAQDHRKERIASALFHRHMLKKGLDAFRWAISRSLHRQDMMKARVQNIQLSASFYKWRERTETRRQRRLISAFKMWRDFTLEAQRARTLRKSLDRKLLQGMLGKWQEMYQLRVKQHKADYYRRHTMLSHMWLSWSDFTALSIQKRSRRQQALAMYRENLQRRILEEMKQTHQKHLRARTHFRLRTLVQMFRMWFETTAVYKVERQCDMKRSKEHWHTVTLTHYFLYWREVLWQRRAMKMDKKTVCRHAFTLWKEKWRVNSARRQQIERQIEMNKLRRSMLLWRENVVLQKRRQAAAIYSLENVLLRQVLGDWRKYTGVKVDRRQRMSSHRTYYNSLKLAECFSTWKRELEKRMDEETAKKFWSTRCAKKASRTWQLLCRKRRLKKMLQESEPLRQLTLQHVMFVRWKEAKEKLDREEMEAANMRMSLDHCQLQRRFHTWRAATELALKIKPLQQRRNHKLIMQSFKGWHSLTTHRKECRESKDRFRKSCLRKALNRWRRQHAIHHIEREIRHRMSMGLALVCLDEWNFVICRKHAAQRFHDAYLLRDTFLHWKSRSIKQMQSKAEAKAEKERKENLKSYYFALWWSNVQEEINETEDAIVMLQQRQAHNRIRRSFIWWRTHLQHTHSGRAYYRVLCQRSMRTVLLEWHLAVDSSLTDAVNTFREELGLPIQEDSEDDRETAIGYMSEGSLASSSGFHSNRELSLWPDFEDNVDVATSSPRSSSSLRLSCNRFLSGDFGNEPGSEQGYDGRSVSQLSNTSLTLADSRAQRREQLKNIVIRAVTRLRLWPVSVVFDQWVEFTARQRQLKDLSSQLSEVHRHAQLSVFLHDWRRAQAEMEKANKHFNKVLTGKAVRALVKYKQRRAAKKKLSALAGRYNSLIVYRQFFPLWLAKTQDRQHQHHILHLWSTTTPEEQQLLPLEHQLQQQFSRRTLRICFAIWSLKFQFASKIKHAYHSGLLKRTLSSWHEWSDLCQIRRHKCEEFRHHRVQFLVFKMWQKRLGQKRESHKRYTETWQSYLHLVLLKWNQWAKVNRQQRMSAIEFVKKRERAVLQQRLTYWQSLTVKVQAVQHTVDSQLMRKVFSAWQEFIQDRNRTRQMVLQFQVHCYTNLVKQLYGRWRQCYMHRLQEKANREELVRLKAAELGRSWRRKAQSSRGRQLHVHFQAYKLRCYFSKWRNAYHLCLDREVVLEQHLVQKSKQCLRKHLEVWRTRQQADQAGRLYNMKLQMAVIEEWRTWARGAKERRIRGLALQRALQERQLTVYYRYWCQVTKVKQMVKSHSHLKLQLRVLQAWKEQAQKQIVLRQQETFLTKKVNQRIMQTAFVTMRCRLDYCQGLSDMAASLQQDRAERTMRATLRTWQARLDFIMASRCYGKFLVVRTVRQWRGFVQRKKNERRIEREKMELAITHSNKKLCCLVLRGLSNELRVKQQQMRRRERLAAKYGRAWKKHADLAHTAVCLESERLYSQMWTRWRVAYSKSKAVSQIGGFEKRQVMSQVFSAWRGLILRNHTIKKSSIPVATASRIPTYSPPVTDSSSPSPRLSQIPSLQARQSYANRK